MVLPILVPTTSGKNMKIFFQGFYFVQKDKSTTYLCPNHNATNGLGCTSKFTLDRDNCGKAKMIDEHNKQCKEHNASNGSKVTDRFWWDMAVKFERIEKENGRILMDNERILMENVELKNQMKAVEQWIKRNDPNFCISDLQFAQTAAQNPMPSFGQIPQNQPQWPMASFHSNEAENVQPQQALSIPSTGEHDYYLSTAGGGQHYEDPNAPSSSSASENMPPKRARMEPAVPPSSFAFPSIGPIKYPQATEEVGQNMDIPGDKDEEEEPLEDQPENVVGEWQYCSICRSFEEIGAEHECKCNCKGNTSSDEAVDVVEEQSCQVFWHQPKPKVGKNH